MFRVALAVVVEIGVAVACPLGCFAQEAKESQSRAWQAGSGPASSGQVSSGQAGSPKGGSGQTGSGPSTAGAGGSTGASANLPKFAQRKIINWLLDEGDGWRIKFGGLAQGAGFSVGPIYRRHGLWQNRLDVAASAQSSLLGFQRYGVTASLPRLVPNRLGLTLEAVHHNYRGLEYYGNGPDSTRGGRSTYRLEDVSLDATVRYTPTARLTLSQSVGQLWLNTGPGIRRNISSIEKVFSAAAVPGLDQQTNFLHTASGVDLDLRDTPGHPSQGGRIFAFFQTYRDQQFGRYSFRRVDMEGQQFFSVAKRQVVALHGAAALTNQETGNAVPFYLQPTLGGPHTLRGFRQWRFHGNHSLLGNVEYQVRAARSVDVVAFLDAGKVSHRVADLNNGRLEKSYGFGLRGVAKNAVVFRLDTGFSREGFQVWLSFSNIFTRMPAQSASPMSDR